MGIKDIQFPFSPEFEEDVRFSLALFFTELGFKSEEMSFEGNFQIQLGHTVITKDKDFSRKTVSGRNDLLLSRYGLPLAMVELKAPDVKFNRARSRSGAFLCKDSSQYASIYNSNEWKRNSNI